MSGIPPYLETVQGRIVEHLFRDLSSLHTSDAEIAETLYYNREAEVRLLARNIEHCRAAGRNILVTGGSAVGKTTLITRCFDKGFVSRENVYPMFFDCRAEGDLDRGLDRTKSILVSLFAGYIRELKKRFPKDKGLDAGAIYKNTDDPIEQFRRAVRMIGDRTPEQRLSLCPILLVDDIDFSEAQLQTELLSMLIPVIKNPTMIYQEPHHDGDIRGSPSCCRDFALSPRLAIEGWFQSSVPCA